MVRCRSGRIPYAKMKRGKWTVESIPFLEGKTAVVTGANSGIGFQVSKTLSLKGARVIMACRSMEKGESAKREIMDCNPPEEPEVRCLDLAHLESVGTFSEGILSSFNGIDLLINNAGVRTVKYKQTRDGFEMNFGVSHLGHFALTAQLWPAIRKARGARIVNVSSLAHHIGEIRFTDIHWERKFRKWGAYGMSKLANMLFTKEMAKRLQETGSGVTATAAHPGYANTDLQTNGLLQAGFPWRARLFHLADILVGQPAWKGALPILYAAVAPDVQQNSYFGPGGLFRLRGWPVPEKQNTRNITDEVAMELWRISEDLTGVRFPVD